MSIVHKTFFICIMKLHNGTGVHLLTLIHVFVNWLLYILHGPVAL